MGFVENAKVNVYEEEMLPYFVKKRREDLIHILKHGDDDQHFPLVIQYIDFCLNCPKSGQALNDSSETIFEAGDKAAIRAMQEIIETTDQDLSHNFKLKRHVHVRIHSRSFPTRSEFYFNSFPGCQERGNFIGLVGTVVRTTAAKSLEFRKFYRCSKCKKDTPFVAPVSRYHLFPRTIDNCQNLCVGAKVELVQAMNEYGEVMESRISHLNLKDYQEVKVQEQVSGLNFGAVTKSFWVILENDLVNSCKPGDDVIITGTLFLRWGRFRPNKDIETHLTFKANHIDVINAQRSIVSLNSDAVKKFEAFWKQHEANPFLGRSVILKSFCPEIYGLYVVKLALCVVLAGGVCKENAGSRVRGESHLLLVGDPGTGKSQLLKYASKLIPRSVFTNGAGTSSAGLTVSAVNDAGEWHLEAGALVLADGGVCCIDEFSNMREHDRVSIHEAMEQQTISVAKAGMVCKLGTKCTILAATNPKLTRYDSAEVPEVNIGLPSPLLSRFDILMILKDVQSDKWDELLCDFILKGRDIIESVTAKARAAGTIWSKETMQSYFMLIREKSPEMTEDAEQILGAYYELQRNSSFRNAARTTVRLLESLFRLAEGHARLMFRDYVLVHDAISAITLMETTMQSSAITEMPNTLHIAFPKDPYEEYYNQAKVLLERLNLPEIWAVEKIYLNNLSRLSKPQDTFIPPDPKDSPDTPPQDENHKETENLPSNMQSIHEWFHDSSELFQSEEECSHETETFKVPEGVTTFTSTQNSKPPLPPPPISPILAPSSTVANKKSEQNSNMQLESKSRLKTSSVSIDNSPSVSPATSSSISTSNSPQDSAFNSPRSFQSPSVSSTSMRNRLKRKKIDCDFGGADSGFSTQRSESTDPKFSGKSDSTIPGAAPPPIKRKKLDLSRFKRQED